MPIAQELKQFLELVFPQELLLDTDTVCYSFKADKDLPSGNGPQPGLPASYTALSKALRGSQQRALYVGTATMRLDPELGLRNQQRLFTGQWLIVLDDIGTGPGAKCPRESLPEGIWDSASYRLETSPDNFQLGFVLEEPIRELAHARAFTALIYSSGPWDGGGAMPNKFVRLPGSANFKSVHGPYGHRFISRLDALTDTVYTPDELLQLAGAGVGWQDIVAGQGLQNDPRRSKGTAAFTPGLTLELDGVIDPLAEWLHANHFVVNERYPWLDIRCPWASEHSVQAPTDTGYSPVGWGYDESMKASRLFHCFHDSCSDNHSQDFIEWAIASGAPPVALRDPAALIASRYIYNAGTNTWLNIAESPQLEIPDTGFKKLHGSKVWFPKSGRTGKTSWGYTTVYNLIAESTLKTAISQYLPGQPLIVDARTEKILNTCRLPFYGTGPIEQVHVDTFLDFIHYLMPDSDDGDWFIRHMAAKVQNPQYRGPCLFMHTPVSGTGRGTLQRLLTQLWQGSVSSLAMPRLLMGLAGADKNDELETLWVVVAEADDSAAGPRYRSYEHLKSFIEPVPVEMTFDRKYGGRWRGPCYASVIICSNHFDGLILDHVDRRVKRIRNTLKRRDNPYFVKLNRWLEAGDWRASVWRYLQEYDIGNYTGTEPQDARLTQTEIDDRLATQSALDKSLQLAEEYFMQYDGIFRTQMVMDTLTREQSALGLIDMRGWQNAAKKQLQRLSARPLGERGQVVKCWVDGKSLSYRVFVNGGDNYLCGLAGGEDLNEFTRERLETPSSEALAEHIKARLAHLD